MRRILSSLLLTLTMLSPLLLKAQVQQITYTEPEREDGRRTNFEIIGKIDGNYLVFKNNNSISGVSIYGLSSLVLFGTIFLIMLIWAAKADKKMIDEISRIPLDKS